MNRSVGRRLERAAHVSRPAPEIDTSGLDADEYMVHAITRHGLQVLLKDLPPLPMQLTDEGREETGKGAALTTHGRAVEMKPPSVVLEPAPEPEPQWWEERCQWRMPGAEDMPDDDFDPYVVDNGREYDPFGEYEE